MNTTAAITLSCISLGVGGVAANLALGGRSGGEAQAAPPAEDTRSRVAHPADERLDALEASVASLTGKIDAALSAPPAQRVEAGVSEEALRAAIEAYFAENEVAEVTAESADALAFEDAAGAFELLQGLGVDESQELWKRLVEAGLDEEVLALFKAAAEADPTNAEAQLALGQAYLGRVQQAQGPEAGKYATLADNALDAALEVDPQHWEARFTKAVALSFWPPIFGKQGQAVAQFETLIEQQSQLPVQDHFADTHLMLGNMYQQMGQTEKAIAAWQSGLQQFPGHAELSQQLGLATQGD